MCIWNVSANERQCKFCSYRQGCEKYPVSGRLGINEDGRRLMETMRGIVGDGVTSRSRLPKYVWGRYIVGYELRRMGYSYKDVAKAVGLDHSTVIHGENLVKLMQKNPVFYQNELEIYDKFNKSKPTSL